MRRFSFSISRSCWVVLINTSVGIFLALNDSLIDRIAQEIDKQLDLMFSVRMVIYLLTYMLKRLERRKEELGKGFQDT